MMRISRSLTTMLACLTGMATGLGAAAAPSPAGKGPSPVLVAQQALLKEYAAAKKEKAGEGLREKCDYFATDKPEDVTPELILAALERPTPGADARADAYVKWQLLSGVVGRFPDNLKARALKVYRAIPSPGPHPGLSKSLLERQLNAIGTMKANAEAGINKDMTDAVARYRTAIEPVLSYRDELLSRIPPGYETIVAALADTYDRVTHGAPANEFWSTLSATIKSWALTEAEPGQLRQLAGAVAKLAETVKDEKCRPYYRVLWTDNESYKGLKWQSEGPITNDKSIVELSEFLAEQAKNPGAGGLKFKDTPDPKGKK